jgi:hypothetical protein
MWNPVRLEVLSQLSLHCCLLTLEARSVHLAEGFDHSLNAEANRNGIGRIHPDGLHHVWGALTHALCLRVSLVQTFANHKKHCSIGKGIAILSQEIVGTRLEMLL